MIQLTKRVLGLLVFSGIVLGLTSCKDSLLYYNTPQYEDGVIDEDLPVRALVQATEVDILWVIDNSGSMDSYQQSVIQNTAVFLDLFRQQGMDWKMGLISTDTNNAPFIGMTAATPLDWTMADAVTKFQGAVQRLGTNGSGYERTFEPLVQHLSDDRYKGFSRPGVPLALIFVTDAEEQSGGVPSEWLSRFKSSVPQASAFYGYGVFAAADFGCSSSDSTWNYLSSPYETFLKGLDGHRTFKLCDPNFGQLLSEISKDILKRTSYYAIPLPFRPKTRTLVVDYKGTILRPGAKADGGQWYYNYEKNAIILYNLDFAAGDVEFVHVYAEEDDGLG